MHRATSVAVADTNLQIERLKSQLNGLEEKVSAGPAAHASGGAAVPDSKCKVCYERTVNSVLLRCGHMCVCMTCSEQLQTCPICRQEITEVVRAFFS